MEERTVESIQEKDLTEVTSAIKAEKIEVSIKDIKQPEKIEMPITSTATVNVEVDLKAFEIPPMQVKDFIVAKGEK